MPQPPPASPAPRQARPGPRVRRIQVIDSLRGFALLGILLMNMISFANPDWILFNPTVHGSFEGVEKWLWVVSHVLADQKFMTIFSPLYGAGILLFTTNLERRGTQPTGVFLRRSLWLGSCCGTATSSWSTRCPAWPYIGCAIAPRCSWP
ncbi:MAG: hypothetical protein J4G06_07015 [Caldilineaceae bacterium]|nr:hypothetical protein [Caldilineaceae bacterium]